jgi:conjugative transposon TraK protein
MMEENKTKSVPSLLETSMTITASFGRLKFITVAAVIAACLTAIACVGYTIYTIGENQKQVFVIDKGQVLTASRENASISLKDRIEFQSKTFHQLMFTVSPNREVVKNNVERALEISDKSAYNYYQDLNEKKFYQRMYQANASQDIRIDSVKIDISRHPYRVATYATLTITRESNISRSSLLTRCSMIDVDMNRKNREGLQIEDFEVLRNDIIETRKR